MCFTVMFQRVGKGPVSGPNIYLSFGAASGLRTKFRANKTRLDLIALIFLLTVPRRLLDCSIFFLFFFCASVVSEVCLFCPHLYFSLSYVWCLGTSVLRESTISCEIVLSVIICDL